VAANGRRADVTNNPHKSMCRYIYSIWDLRCCRVRELER
jgi:hypothetical protein